MKMPALRTVCEHAHSMAGELAVMADPGFFIAVPKTFRSFGLHQFDALRFGRNLRIEWFCAFRRQYLRECWCSRHLRRRTDTLKLWK